MGSRLALHAELLKHSTNVYFQPPSNEQMIYPCIVYSKTGRSRQFGNNGIYLSKQEYQLMVIDKSPDSMVPDDLEEHFQYCRINQYYVVDNLNHTTLTLFY
jgi:hypothetical protein